MTFLDDAIDTAFVLVTSSTTVAEAGARVLQFERPHFVYLVLPREHGMFAVIRWNELEELAFAHGYGILAETLGSVLASWPSVASFDPAHVSYQQLLNTQRQQDRERLVVLRDGVPIGVFAVNYRSKEQGQTLDLLAALKDRDAVLSPPPHQQAQPSPPPPFRAYANLHAPRTVEPHARFDIYVGFRAAPDPALDDTGELVFAPGSPDHQCRIELTCDGIELDRLSDTLPLRQNIQLLFRAIASAVPTHAWVEVAYYLDHQLVGMARRTILVGADMVDDLSAAEANPCHLSNPRAEQAVDLLIKINRIGGDMLAWRWTSKALNRVIDHPLKSRLGGATSFASELVTTIDGVDHRDPGLRNVLESFGQQIASLIPDQLQNDLYRLGKQVQRAPTVLLVTDELLVPWELALLRRPLDPARPHFLGAQAIVGRWLADPQVLVPPRIEVQVQHVTVVASDYARDTLRPLTQALAEQHYLAQHVQARVLPARYEELGSLTTGERLPGHVVHFAVHGMSDPKLETQQLLLEEQKVMTARQMIGSYRCGDEPRFAFAFLNACQVGTPGETLGQAGGFPAVFVRGGTHGFVAPLWSIDDSEAYTMAVAFYEAVLGSEQVSVGEVLHRQRQAAFSAGGSVVALAYIYYGHPALRLVPTNGLGTRGSITQE